MSGRDLVEYAEPVGERPLPIWLDSEEQPEPDSRLKKSNLQAHYGRRLYDADGSSLQLVVAHGKRTRSSDLFCLCIFDVPGCCITGPLVLGDAQGLRCCSRRRGEPSAHFCAWNNAGLFRNDYAAAQEHKIRYCLDPKLSGDGRILLGVYLKN